MTLVAKILLSAVLLVFAANFSACNGTTDPPGSIEGVWTLTRIDGSQLPLILGEDTVLVDGDERVIRTDILSAELEFSRFDFVMIGAIVHQRVDIVDDPDTISHAVLADGAAYDYDDGKVVLDSSLSDFTLHDGRVDGQGRLVIDADVHPYGPAELRFVRAAQ